MLNTRVVGKKLRFSTEITIYLGNGTRWCAEIRLLEVPPEVRSPEICPLRRRHIPEIPPIAVCSV